MNRFEIIVDNAAGVILLIVILGIIGFCIFAAGPETVPIKLTCMDLQVEPKGRERCSYVYYTELKIKNGGIKPYTIYCPKCFRRLDWWINKEGDVKDEEN